MISYPAELTIGKTESTKDPLSQFFKDRGWDATWDFDDNGYWFEIFYIKKLIIQVEFGTSVEDMLRSIKRLVPAFDPSITDSSSLQCVYDSVVPNGPQVGLYLWPIGKKPQRKNFP